MRSIQRLLEKSIHVILLMEILFFIYFDFDANNYILIKVMVACNFSSRKINENRNIVGSERQLECIYWTSAPEDTSYVEITFI